MYKNMSQTMEHKNVTINAPALLHYTLEQLQMKNDTELTNMFVNTLIDTSIGIINGKELELVEFIRLFRKYKIDYSNEYYFKSLLMDLSAIISEFAVEVLRLNLEHHDLIIVTCLSEKILIRKGVCYEHFKSR